MTHDEILGAVRRAVGDAFGERELRELAATGSTWEAGPGELLVDEGHVATQGYIVLRGSATVCVGAEPVARLGPGSLIWAGADWGVMPARVVAEEPMWLLLLGPDLLRRLARVTTRAARGTRPRVRSDPSS